MIIEQRKEECKILEYTYEFTSLQKISMKYIITDEAKESRNSLNVLIFFIKVNKR